LKDVVILGGGGFAREVWWVLEESNLQRKEWNILGFIDENPEAKGRTLCNLPVLGGFDWFRPRPNRPHVICGVGSNATRRKFAAQAHELGLEFCTAIHPSARMSRFVEVGIGSVICAGNTLTTQIVIGAQVNVNLHCTIGHDARIGDFCNISPGVHLSGYVVLEEGVDVGTGVAVLPGKKVGRGSVIGSGAVVTSDIPPFSVALGVPAKVTRTLQPNGAGG
jgi:sugar O-acyltransferase (sialic acid O-acetyltransferase NeuD family)